MRIYETIGFECEIREGMIKKEAFAKIDLSCKRYHVYLENVSFLKSFNKGFRKNRKSSKVRF